VPDGVPDGICLDGKKTQKKKKHHQVKRVRLKNRTKARQQDARYHGRKDD
jgi:hypothetical protein